MPLCDLCENIIPTSFLGYKGKNSDITKILVLGHFADYRVIDDNWLEPFTNSLTGKYFIKYFLGVSGLSMEDIFFVNSYRCLKKSVDDAPTQKELKRCLQLHLFDIVNSFNPKVLITWGRPVLDSLSSVLNLNIEGESLKLDKGMVIIYRDSFIYATYHPSYWGRYSEQRVLLGKHFANFYNALA
ncbi:MAG: uracil-DNA glycosylase family protein [Candidatus Woesearchaeota archaeon]